MPIPIPGDLLVIGAGVASAGDAGSALLALGAILLAGYLGGAVQFLLVRGALRRALITLLTRVGWVLLRRRNREPQNRFAAWADAACPACLALNALGAESVTYTADQR